MRFLRIAIVFIMLLFFGGFFYISSETDIQQVLIEFLQHSESHYLWIILIIFGICLISTISGLPVLYLSVALGFFFKFLHALALAWTINLLAILGTFLLVRGVYGEYFKGKYGKKKVISRINQRIRKYGYRTVAISRAVYFIPTNIINLSFPLSKIAFKQYAIGTMLGLVPESLINVTSGYLLKHEVLLMSSPEGNYVKIIIIAASILLIILVFILFRKRSKLTGKDKIDEIIPLPEDE